MGHCMGMRGRTAGQWNLLLRWGTGDTIILRFRCSEVGRNFM